MKSRSKMKKTLIFSLFIFGFLVGFSQIQHDSLITKNRKNVIRVNLTPTLFFGFNNYVVGYERVFQGHNSISLNIGYLTLPEVFNSPLAKYGIVGKKTNFGYSIAADYRRYFKKRNRGFAPDGLYFGPYLVNYNYANQNKITFDDSYGLGESQVTLTSNINVFHTGIQFGYQFIIYKRLALDFIVLGPGLGHYSLKLGLNANLDAEIEDEVYKDIYNSIIENYPGLENTLETKSISKNGRLESWGPGYRFVIQLGFLF